MYEKHFILMFSYYYDRYLKKSHYNNMVYEKIILEIKCKPSKDIVKVINDEFIDNNNNNNIVMLTTVTRLQLSRFTKIVRFRRFNIK